MSSFMDLKKSIPNLSLFGTFLSLLILGSSMLLRLSTVFDMDGLAQNSLPANLEWATRLLHRLCASCVALIALVSVIQSWFDRLDQPWRFKPSFWIFSLTLVLALIGPLTPGYRLASITVINVSCGIALVLAFWFLHLIQTRHSAAHACMDGAAQLTCGVYFLHIATGAGASAFERHGVHWPVFVHLASLLLFSIVTGLTILKQHEMRTLSSPTQAWAGLLIIQIVMGYALMGENPRPLALSLIHGMLSPLVALAMVCALLTTPAPNRI